ncbi:2-amino-4-hydroxy-6-hydroxymethyldihydropteridine diphosphokinase [Fluviicoccus keumensis]|uniref:2-amino-4-hydroxy-6-hydroxymethyldihydropteridine pyrophosphokinase n=1 Tax=Fluviicoccus keumensis TaxID=1435465 RepID=A0A4Q7ZB70_9GAMM|nr:2-amino-4-hydroxy-6-hydroxymethyldihydropteridine diphosphokinase [Fluviicoccus keumensis]RZU47059.1 2-amino-4-hydroxy-6-hydroxymethyldihydropteridine diphosphokinase [Fluviicoccus keumensis]
MSYTAFIGLGANLGDPRQQLIEAIQCLSGLPHTRITGVSRLYGSAPVGPQDQPDYVNAVARLETGLTPHRLLAELQAIENNAGRIRERHWGPRTLDLDLLLYARDEIRTANLTVPHLEMVNRAFVLVPLLDIDPEAVLPNGLKAASLQAATPGPDLHVLADSGWWQP